MSSGKKKTKRIKKYTPDEIKTIISEYLTIQNSSAALRLAFEHYMFLEIKEDGINPYLESASDDIRRLEEIIDDVYIKGAFSPADERKKITGLRNRFIKLTEVLAQYADRFSLFEYVFNRLEYKFCEHDKLDTDEIIQKAISYIFESDDTMVINTRLLSIIGQLPVRMTKGRLMDMVKDGAMVYNGSDRTSFDMFLMNLSDCAGITKIDQSVPEFEKFRDELADFENLKLSDLDKKQFESYQRRLDAVTENLQNLNDIYSSLTGMANALFINVLCAPLAEPVAADSPEVIVIRGTYSLFNDTENSVWDDFTHPVSDDFEDRMGSLDSYLEMTEGMQERNSGRAQMVYPVVEKICEDQQMDVQTIFGRSIINLIDTVTKLAGSSMYMEIEEPEDDRPEKPEKESAGETEKDVGSSVTGKSEKEVKSAVPEKNSENGENTPEQELLTADKEYIREETAEFNRKLQERLTSVDRPLKRAVMAAVIEKLPIFFKESREVVDYITDSLKYCDNENERQASLNAVNMASEM